jgi:predicted DsbA family dithiol-disulfide isomerase
MRVEVWSDLICPWCYVGKRRFERALAGFPHRHDVEVVHRSFELDPSTPRNETQDNRARLAEKYGLSEEQARAAQQRMAGLAAEEGLEFRRDGGRVGNTFDAHQLVHLARERGLQDQVIERLFRAHFTEQRSLFDHDSLVDLAAEAGLDREEARTVLTKETYARAVRADEAQAHALGASGVPFFVFDDRYGVSGAQRSEIFSDVLARAWAEAHPGQPAPASVSP